MIIISNIPCARFGLFPCNSGIIGYNWAIIFSSFNYRVQLYDTNQQCLRNVKSKIQRELLELNKQGLTRGNSGLTVDQQMALISTAESLEECLQEAIHVQESVFDDLELKQNLFGQIDELVGRDNGAAASSAAQAVALCSSTSIHLPSLVFAKVTKHKSHCLVAHPVNPPLHVPLVELIPVPGVTRDDILARTRALMDEIGQKPVVLRKEVSGFALNRLQYAVFQVAFRLVHEGVMTPGDVDTVVSEGLGPRYAFMGPWMTAHLNAHGMRDYYDRYTEGIYRVSRDCLTPLLKLEGPAAETIAESMFEQVPVDRLDEKRAWRDKCLIELAQVKKRLRDNKD